MGPVVDWRLCEGPAPCWWCHPWVGCGFLMKACRASHGKQANKELPSWLLLQFLPLRCSDFLWWCAMIWKFKQNSPSKLLLAMLFYHSPRELTVLLVAFLIAVSNTWQRHLSEKGFVYSSSWWEGTLLSQSGSWCLAYSFFCFSRHRVSLYYPGYPGTHAIDQADFELSVICLPLPLEHCQSA